MEMIAPLVLVGADGAVDFFRDTERLRSYVDSNDTPARAYDAAGRVLELRAGPKVPWWRFRPRVTELIVTEKHDPAALRVALEWYREICVDAGVAAPAEMARDAPVTQVVNAWVKVTGYCGEPL